MRDEKKRITLNMLEDLSWDNVISVAYYGAKLEIGDALLNKVSKGRQTLETLIDNGVPAYGVTTGLGELVKLNLSEAERNDLPHNILRARSAAIGEPLPKPVVRATMMLKLFNFLTGFDGVSADLVQFLTARLNDDFTPYIPQFGHGMGADATAQTHCFQTFIGEGFVLEDGERMAAMDALKRRHVAPMQLKSKEGLALLNGIGAAPAYAIEAQRRISAVLDVATRISAVSIEGSAAPKDAFNPHLKTVSRQTGVHHIIDQLDGLLKNSDIQPFKLQAGISIRIIPQVHGALFDALATFKQHIEDAMHTFSDNPLMWPDAERFLSVGLFHNQHLVNQADHLAIALTHVGSLSVHRLHRLLDSANTGLNHQLAARPGLDAGLVVAQKAALGIAARLKQLANPLSIHIMESSQGQEDYMSLAIPTIDRLLQMVELVEMILSYELFGALTALSYRDAVCGEGVRAIQTHFAALVPPLSRDRSPSPDVELILNELRKRVI